MKLKITTPERSIYEGEIKAVSIPTDNGAAIIHANKSKASVLAVKPGLIKILPTQKPTNNHEFIVSHDEIVISISKGMAFIDGETIRIVSTQATTIPNTSKTHLKESKSNIENQIKALKAQWSIEQIELWMTKLQKINADISLEEIKLNRQ